MHITFFCCLWFFTIGTSTYLLFVAFDPFHGYIQPFEWNLILNSVRRIQTDLCKLLKVVLGKFITCNIEIICKKVDILIFHVFELHRGNIKEIPYTYCLLPESYEQCGFVLLHVEPHKKHHNLH